MFFKWLKASEWPSSDEYPFYIVEKIEKMSDPLVYQVILLSKVINKEIGSDNSDYIQMVRQFGRKNIPGDHRQLVELGLLRKSNQRETFNYFTVKELKIIAKRVGIKVSGRKADIIDTLMENKVTTEWEEIPIYNLTEKGKKHLKMNHLFVEYLKEFIWVETEEYFLNAYKDLYAHGIKDVPYRDLKEALVQYMILQFIEAGDYEELEHWLIKKSFQEKQMYNDDKAQYELYVAAKVVSFITTKGLRMLEGYDLRQLQEGSDYYSQNILEETLKLTKLDKQMPFDKELLFAVFNKAVTGEDFSKEIEIINEPIKKYYREIGIDKFFNI